MALIQAEVDIAVQSLDKFGGNIFTLANQATEPNGIRANRHFAQTRNALLRSLNWPFAKVRLRLVSEWLTDTAYTTDQYVWQNALLYKCAVAHTSDDFDTDLGSGNWTLKSSVDDWATATDYIAGDFVVNNAILYKCILAHTSGDTDDEPGVGATTDTFWVVSTTRPTNVFGFNYDMPTNSLKLVLVFDNKRLNWVKPNSLNNWELEGNTILTDDSLVDIVYINNVTTTTEWDSLFTEIFICKLALKLQGSVTGMGSAAVNYRRLMLEELRRLNSFTRSLSRQEGGRQGNNNWLNARLIQRVPRTINGRVC